MMIISKLWIVMQEYIKKSNISRVINHNTKESKQMTVSDILQNHQNRTLDIWPIQRKLIIGTNQKFAIPDRNTEMGLINAADKYKVPEAKITDVIGRWMAKKKLYIFVSWDAAFDEAAKGALKAVRNKDDKIDELGTGREAELEDIAERERKDAKSKLKSEAEKRLWDEATPARKVVKGLQEYARSIPNKVAAVAIDPANMTIEGKGRSGTLAGKYYKDWSCKKIKKKDGSEDELTTELTKAYDNQEDWVPWACAEAAAGENLIKAGKSIAGKEFLAGEKGGALHRKPACRNCSKWVREIGVLNLGPGLSY